MIGARCGGIGWVCVWGGRWFGDDQVGIGAGHAKGTDTGHTDGAVHLVWPRHTFVDNTEGAVGPVNMGIGLVEVQTGRQRMVLQSQDHFDDSGDTGRGLGVADVGFDGADEQRIGVRASFSVDTAECACFDWVAERGAGAMCFDVADLGWVGLGKGQRLLDHGFLCRPIGDGECAAGSIVVDC